MIPTGLHWLKMVSGLFLLACLLPGTAAANSVPAKLSVEYVYALDGTLTGRVVNGQVQNFEYDKRGQLLAVTDAQGNDLERYVYDPAGNILSKTVHGRTTRFTYDAANQITSRTDPDGSVIRYQYDAAGRLISEGTRTYHYGWQDKVEEIRENGKTVARFTYGLDGQLESVTRADGSVEHFHWDGLALIGRGKLTFLNEPYVTGGNPIASDGKAMLNDMLGSTVGIRDGETMTPVAMTAFGESCDPEAMYTGKPHVDGLGYAFLFRNYRAELGKWQTADPLGYPDGWNQLAYCNNGVIYLFDFLGGWTKGFQYTIVDTGVPLYVNSTRTPDRDLSLANQADWFFWYDSAPLSQALVEHAKGSTDIRGADYIVPESYHSAIQSDSGFMAVRRKVSQMMSNVKPKQTVNFNGVPVATTLTSHDLATAIHGVIFKLNGSITADENGRWSGVLEVSFSDPYDFDAHARDWKVRVYGRLWENGWISKFYVVGSLNVYFAE